MKKILLPVDGSKRSIRTVEMVKQLCDPADSDITVVKVVSAQLYINSMDEIKHNAAPSPTITAGTRRERPCPPTPWPPSPPGPAP